MHIIINTSSMVPIYEQIVNSVKGAMVSGEIGEEEALPSVRALASELKISALTVKKAYDKLEEEGLAVTVHGKGTFIRRSNGALIREEQVKSVETELTNAVVRGRSYGLTDNELRSLFDMILEE